MYFQKSNVFATLSTIYHMELFCGYTGSKQVTIFTKKLSDRVQNTPVKLFTFNPCSTNVPIVFPLKTSENRRFSDVFKGDRSGILVENRLMR